MLSCLASANGCIADASRAWYSMSKDTLIPKIFSALHPKYKTPHRAILFLLPISIAFGFTGLLDQVITFSILSALFVYILTGFMMFKFRRMYPLGTIQRGYVSLWHPLPVIEISNEAINLGNMIATMTEYREDNVINYIMRSVQKSKTFSGAGMAFEPYIYQPDAKNHYPYIVKEKTVYRF